MGLSAKRIHLGQTRVQYDRSPKLIPGIVSLNICSFADSCLEHCFVTLRLNVNSDAECTVYGIWSQLIIS